MTEIDGAQSQQDTELEAVLKMTVEKQSRRIAGLMLDLDLAHSQIELMKTREQTDAGAVEIDTD